MHVYILFSEKSSKYYVGQTADMNERLKRHNEGRSKCTKSGAPWKIIFLKRVESRSEAVLLERKIKKRGAKRDLSKNTSGCSVARLSRPASGGKA